MLSWDTAPSPSFRWVLMKPTLARFYCFAFWWEEGISSKWWLAIDTWCWTEGLLPGTSLEVWVPVHMLASSENNSSSTTCSLLYTFGGGLASLIQGKYWVQGLRAVLRTYHNVVLKCYHFIIWTVHLANSYCPSSLSGLCAKCWDVMVNEVLPLNPRRRPPIGRQSLRQEPGVQERLKAPWVQAGERS